MSKQKQETANEVTSAQSELNVGLGIGEYVRNKKTGVRGDVMVIYDNSQIRVVRHPADIQAGTSRWQTWELEDVERMPNVKLRGDALLRRPS